MAKKRPIGGSGSNQYQTKGSPKGRSGRSSADAAAAAAAINAAATVDVRGDSTNLVKEMRWVSNGSQRTASIDISALYSDDPGTTVAVDDGPNVPVTTGINYDKDLRPKDVASIMRKALNEAIKAGALEGVTGAKVSSSTKGSSSVNVSLVMDEDPMVNVLTPGTHKNQWGDAVRLRDDDEPYTKNQETKLTREALAARTKAESFYDTFVRDASDTMTDLFRRNHWGQVSVQRFGDWGRSDDNIRGAKAIVAGLENS